MKGFLSLGLLFIAAQAQTATSASPELIKLERSLTDELKAKTEGVVSQQQYQIFLGDFRPTLNQTVVRAMPSAENSAAHARILMLLGDHTEAVASLTRALKDNPQDPTLKLSLGQTYLEQKNYSGAFDAANEILKLDPTNANALFLRSQSTGRRAPSTIHSQSEQPSPVADFAPRSKIEFTNVRDHRANRTVVPDAITDAPLASGKHPPLLPIVVPLGGALIGYGALSAANRKKLKVAAASVLIAVTVVYGLPRAIRAAPAYIAAFKAAFDRSGQSLQQASASELSTLGQEANGTIQSSRPLLNAAQAIIDPRKLTEYALNQTHSTGMHKARVFQSALGFTSEHAEDLIAQVRQGILTAPSTPGLTDGFGPRMTVDLLIKGPAGQAIVRTGWIYDPGSTAPRLTTIFVK